MSTLIETLRATASEWRARYPGHAGGIVLVWQETAYGWKDSLRDPGQDRPGSYAVDEAGHVFIARGGDDYNGAECWVTIDASRG